MEIIYFFEYRFPKPADFHFEMKQSSAGSPGAGARCAYPRGLGDPCRRAGRAPASPGPRPVPRGASFPGSETTRRGKPIHQRCWRAEAAPRSVCSTSPPARARFAFLPFWDNRVDASPRLPSSCAGRLRTRPQQPGSPRAPRAFPRAWVSGQRLSAALCGERRGRCQAAVAALRARHATASRPRISRTGRGAGRIPSLLSLPDSFQAEIREGGKRDGESLFLF